MEPCASNSPLRSAGAIVPAGIYGARGLRQQRVAKQKQIIQTLIAQAIMDKTAALLAGDEAAFAETPQMVRRVRLRQTRDRDDLADRQRPRAQSIKN